MAKPVDARRPVSVEHVVTLIERLRGKDGCPWDKKQTPDSMSRYLIEETYELVDAIITGDANDICEEAGDVLFQLLFVIHLFREDGSFDLQDVIEKNIRKMVRRHPHVFGDAQAETPERVSENWQKIKLAEKGGRSDPSVLDSIPKGMPAIRRAATVSERAAKTGFDWHDISGVMDKTTEEWQEFSEEIKVLDNMENGEKAAVEFGDVLFSMVNVARFAKIDPEIALMRSIQKFEKRFRYMEDRAKDSGHSIDGLTFEEMHRLWDDAKADLG